MSFLAPLFLLGAAAVALPVIFHLIRRTTREKKVFSSLLFLTATPPRLTRRSKLEHLLLLATRCLVIILLALGFSRPFLKKPYAAEPPAVAQRIALLVDTSASMRRPNLWAEAKQKAESLMQKAGPLDKVAVYSFDRDLKELVGFEEWNSAPAGERVSRAIQKLSDISPGWSETRLAGVLTSAAELLNESRENQVIGSTKLVVISDLQQGSQHEALQGYVWPKGVEIDFQIVKPQHSGNASMQLLSDSENVSNPNGAVRVRVSNSADSKREQFKIGWAATARKGFIGPAQEIYVPAGQSRILTLSRPPASALSLDHLVLEGDGEDFDNNLYLAHPSVVQVQILYFGNDSGADSKKPLFFLERAFQESGEQMVHITPHSPAGPLAAKELQNANLFIIASGLPADTAQVLFEQLKSGRTALVSLQSPADASGLARLLGLEQVHLEEANPGSYAMLGEIDFQHPLFLPFAEPKFSDFTKIHFWKYRKLAPETIPGARAIAKFDNGDPALLDIPVGKGRLLLLTCGWQPEESQLALSTKFVPLLYAVLEESGVPSAEPAQYKIDDVVAVKSSQSTIVLPDGSRKELAAGSTNFSDTVMPGVYTITSENPPRTFAVNVAPSESRTAPLSAEELERLGVPLSRGEQARAIDVGRKVVWHNAELENRQKMWRWLLAVTLLVVLFETWLAGRTGRKSVNQSTNRELEFAAAPHPGPVAGKMGGS